jgi:hypothetical protein
LIAILAVGVGLRCWDLGGTRLSFDETFTAVAARMPLRGLLTYLRHNDAHPPLDYLLRAPLARARASEAWLRAPSALESVASLVVAAWWWRRLGRVGLIATGLLAMSSFAVTYAHDARMYAGFAFAGIVVGAVASSWLERPSLRALLAAGVGLSAALWLQGGALLVVPGVLAVPGLRRDRLAWQWRATALAAVTFWAVLWGPSFITQASGTSHSWVPLTTPHVALVTVNELVDSTPFVALLVLGLAVAGAMCIPCGSQRRVAAALGWGVIATYVVVGLHAHVLLPRALAFAAWAPMLALAALCDRALTRSPALGAAMLALVAAVVVPSVLIAASPAPAPAAKAFTAVRSAARPGDEVVMTPAFLWTMPAWYFGARWGTHASHVDRADLKASGVVIGSGTPSGRVWLLVSVVYEAKTGGLAACAPPEHLDGLVVYCLQERSGAA